MVISLKVKIMKVEPDEEIVFSPLEGTTVLKDTIKITTVVGPVYGKITRFLEWVELVKHE